MKKLVMFALVTALGLSMTAPALANERQEPTSVTPPAATNWQTRCTDTQDRNAERLSALAELHTKNATRLNDLLGKMSEMAAKFEDMGIDASEMNEHIATLSGLIAELEADHNAVAAQMQVIIDLDCSAIDQATFQAEMDQLRGLMEDVKTDVESLKSLKSAFEETFVKLKAEIGNRSDDDSGEDTE